MKIESHIPVCSHPQYEDMLGNMDQPWDFNQDCLQKPVICSDPLKKLTTRSNILPTDAAKSHSLLETLLQENTIEYKESLVITTQEQLDYLLAHKQKVTGNIIITGDNIVSLRSLSRLTFIDGTLKIKDCPKLHTLEGLDRLTTITKSLIIRGLPSIKSINHFKHLQRSHGVFIGDCENLTGMPSIGALHEIHEFSLHNLPKLSSIPKMQLMPELDSLSISSCPNLMDYMGLSHLSHIKTLRISSMNELIDFAALPKLKTIGYLDILNCNNVVDLHEIEGIQINVLQLACLPLFKNFNGLQQQTHIKALYLNDLPNFSSFQGLENVEQLGYVICGRCPQIKNLHELKALKNRPHISVDDIKVRTALIPRHTKLHRSQF